MDSQCILAIDLGTTNCKTLLVDESCRIVEKVSVEYPVSMPRPGWGEQEPEDWWAAVKGSIQKILRRAAPDSVKAIGLSGQMHGLVILNPEGVVPRPAILWNDQRSFEQCEAVYRLAGGRSGLLAYTNNAMLPGYTGGKILWIRDHEPEVYEQISKIFLPKDYIRYRLTGDIATDFSDASGTGLFNVKEQRWSFELVEKLGLPGRWFPKCSGASEIVGEVEARLAAELGLAPHTPVIAGGGDAVMQTVGARAIHSDTVLTVIGTGGNVTVSVPDCIDNPDGKLQVFCHVIPGRWTAMGVTLSAGNSLKWFRDALGGLEIQAARDLQVDPYELISREAALSTPGSRGLVFLPYLQGERCPHVDVRARGTFTGLGLHTQKSDVIRSIMEGVTYSLRDVLALMNRLGIQPCSIHTSGGGASSPVWRQIQADVFNKTVTTLNYSEDASAIGAAIIAGVRAGFWPSVEAAVSLIEPKTIDQPIPGNAETYDRYFRVYQNLYPALKPSFDELAQLAA